jgi:hypothetical protein
MSVVSKHSRLTVAKIADNNIVNCYLLFEMVRIVTAE